MPSESITAAIRQVMKIEAEIGALWRTIDAESLSISERQYLSRCFDLLTIELGAVRDYLDHLS